MITNTNKILNLTNKSKQLNKISLIQPIGSFNFTQVNLEDKIQS